MSNDSTVSSSGESIDGVYSIRHEWHSSNSQNENSGTGQVEISEFLRYPRNFFDRVTGGLPKMKKQHVVCGPIGRQDKTMEVD